MHMKPIECFFIGGGVRGAVENGDNSKYLRK